MEGKNQTWKTDRSRLRLDLAARLSRPQRMSSGAGRSAVEPEAGFTTPRRAVEASDLRQHPVDIVCAGMYRACSTWQYEVVAHLIEQYSDGRRLGYLTGQQYSALRRSEAENRQPSTKRVCRVFKSHDGDRVFAEAVRDGQARVIYAYRDVRDVVFSLMHKRGLKFEQLVRQGMIHQVLANDRFWMAQPDLLVQRYDDLVADPAGGVMTLARFLGIVLGRTEAVRIAETYSQEANRARTEALRDRLRQSGVDLESASNRQICDPATLLHWNHLRPGSGSSWIEQAGPTHRVVLKRLCGKWLQARGYESEPASLPHSPVRLVDLARIEVDLLAGRANILLQNGSRKYPRLSHAIKRLLGLPIPAQAGAIAWSDAVTAKSAIREPHIHVDQFLQ